MDHSTLITLFKLLGYNVHVLHDQTAQVPETGKTGCKSEGWATLGGQTRLLLLCLLGCVLEVVYSHCHSLFSFSLCNLVKKELDHPAVSVLTSQGSCVFME